MSGDSLEGLLDLAHEAVLWAEQSSEGIEGTAGAPHYTTSRDAYFKARLAYFVNRRPFRLGDWGPYYHEAAAMQPWNHRIPWNCPSYWDGCNCEGGPFYSEPEAAS